MCLKEILSQTESLVLFSTVVFSFELKYLKYKKKKNVQMC